MIGASAFPTEGTRITSITIPATVTTIEIRAFTIEQTENPAKSTLTSVTFASPSQLRTIGESAFAKNPFLTSITIPDGVTTIGDSAFAHTGLTSITIPSSVTTIGERAFEYLDKLTSITFAEPSSLTAIGKYALFNNSPNSTGGRGPASIRLPASVTAIGEGAFYFYSLSSITVDPANRVYSSVDGVLFDKAQRNIIFIPLGKTAFTIPPTMTAIPKGILHGGEFGHKLASLTIPATVTTIEDGAFADSFYLTSVTIGTPRIGNQMFQNCTNLTSVTMLPSVQTIGAQAFYGCEKLPSVVIGSGVTTIEHHAFFHCIRLVNLTIPPSVKTIGDYAFADTTNELAGFVVPSTVTSVGEMAFTGPK